MMPRLQLSYAKDFASSRNSYGCSRTNLRAHFSKANKNAAFDLKKVLVVVFLTEVYQVFFLMALIKMIIL